MRLVQHALALAPCCFLVANFDRNVVQKVCAGKCFFQALGAVALALAPCCFVVASFDHDVVQKVSAGDVLSCCNVLVGSDVLLWSALTTMWCRR